ncbi:type VI secretion system protein TssL, long form [Nitratireductor sp. ZSWI3]|uniref:type VI secretion system protein TssL, long form n=1 Tax=Nitratireductor sp. ZSWI3 TaxID=2966359 RepID=UPI00214FDF2A|nr:type VI secretion system protein TssL, long form [Nitratireductor sp. ZSWI3]MCR4266308.1 type VI secretion system protein TssL, long form [Nitratireductor sp. ZSWI3]
MNKQNSISWQDLPTVIELTDDSARKQKTAQQMADILDDVIEPVSETANDGATNRRPPQAWSVEAMVRDFRFGGSEVPTIVASAAPLLNLAHAIRQSDTQPDTEQLRRVTTEAIRRYERDLASARISPERARAAHYVMCATVDDVILSKSWGVRAGWARSGLVSTFHMDVTGGDKVFDLLDHFHKTPASSKDLLLLIYLCLSLAFEGRTRVSPRGTLELSRIRENLYKTLLGQYGVFERELSPHWKGVAARHKPLRTAVALWTLLSVLALVFAFGYLFFTLSLNRASDGTFSRLASVGPADAPSVAALPRPVPEPVEEPPVIVTPPEPERPSALENLLAFLQPDVERGTVQLADADGRLLVRIANTGLFDVGSADVSEEFVALFSRIGAALASEDFRALVVGYTDDRPIRTAQFPSNWQLSEARAKAVGDILAQFTGPEAILTVGRAESDPIADNSTREGREANRRTEILVLTDPRESLEAAGIAPLRSTPLVQGGAEEGGRP